MKTRTIFCSTVFALAICVFATTPRVSGALCQTVTVSIIHPDQEPPNQPVPVTTTVTGSCASDGEDYFAVRVDLVDTVSQLTLSSNSTPVGYNANNFSVRVQNVALTPNVSESWPINVDTYLVEAGSISGKNLLNATTITIQVGGNALPEFQFKPSLLLALLLTGATLTVASRRKKADSNGAL